MKIFINIIALLLPLFLSAQGFKNHSFPRTAQLQWGGAPDEWYAKFDLLFMRQDNKAYIDRIRALNPNLMWLIMRDFNRADEYLNGFPSTWFLRDSKGNKIVLYGGNTYWANLSELCPTASGTINGVGFTNQRLHDFFPIELERLVRQSGAEGIVSDGLYYRLHLEWNMFPDVDLDNNGQNDLTEPGKGKNWVINRWVAGVDKFLTKLRSLLGNEKLIVINTGSQDLPTEAAVNGLYLENTGGIYSWDYDKGLHPQLFNRAFDPPIFTLNNKTDPSNPSSKSWSQEDFQYMRLGLTRAMLFGYYFDLHTWESGEHYWTEYYDEFELDIGQPTGQMREATSGIWVRFFERGLAATNVTESPRTLTDAHLRALPGYGGPYWHFLGGQDTTRNHGRQFNALTLNGYSFTGYGNTKIIAGDGVVLVNPRRTAIADIVVDNVRSGTTPGARSPVFSAGWSETCDGEAFYTLRCASWVDNSYGMHTTSQAGRTAVFRFPARGRAGTYDIYEWHGRPAGGGAASAVKHEVTHASGTVEITVNQSANSGRWNLLGRYTLNPNSSVRITSGSGVTMADAIKFVYQDGREPEPDNDPPAAPKNVRIE